MFDTVRELTVKSDYEERIRSSAAENFATRLERLNPQPSWLSRLSEGIGNSLVHLGYHFQRRAHTSVRGVVAPR